MNYGCSQQPCDLYSLCLNYLCNNIDLYCYKNQNQDFRSSKKEIKYFQYNFVDKTLRFNHVISEDFLERLCDLDKLNDSILSLFSSDQICLKKFHVKNCLLSKDAIKRVLKQHQINELIVNNLQIENVNSQISNQSSSIQNITINDLINSLNDKSLENLVHLNVSRNKSLFSSIITNFKSLKNLTKLNVSFTCFNNLCLDIVCQDLINLEHLDISATKISDLSPLMNLKDKLKHLYMYNMRASLGDDIIKVLTSIVSLQSLDLSCDVSTKIFSDMTLSMFDVNQFLDALVSTRLKYLKYLDISGKIGIKQECLMNFLRVYTDLKFIGLALTNANSFDELTHHSDNNTFHISVSSPSLISLQRNLESCHFKELNLKELIITGESTESQILSSLKYYKSRPNYLQKALYNLFILTRNYSATRADLVQNVLDVMLSNLKSQSIQLAATTFYFLPLIKLQKNCLIILCNESMLNKCTFKKFDCIKATLECLNNFKDQNTISSSIAICAQVSLNAELEVREKFIKLIDAKYLKNLLSIIVNHTRNLGNIENDESIIHSIIDIIFYLSENNMEWYRNFITQNGLNVYHDLMLIFETDLDAQFKLMCLVYKLSEIAEIRPVLFVHPILKAIKNLVNHEDISLKFLSIGFMANFLAFMPDSHWDWNMVKFDDLKYNLKPRIELIKQNWNFDLNLMIEYKQLNLEYLNKLINKQHEPFVQIWSLWAINTYNRLNVNKNGSLLIKKHVHNIINDKTTPSAIKEFCSDLIEIV